MAERDSFSSSRDCRNRKSVAMSGRIVLLFSQQEVYTTFSTHWLITISQLLLGFLLDIDLPSGETPPAHKSTST